jgi:hypothetical protein
MLILTSPPAKGVEKGTTPLGTRNPWNFPTHPGILSTGHRLIKGLDIRCMVRNAESLIGLIIETKKFLVRVVATVIRTPQFMCAIAQGAFFATLAQYWRTSTALPDIIQ